MRSLVVAGRGRFRARGTGGAAFVIGLGYLSRRPLHGAFHVSAEGVRRGKLQGLSRTFRTMGKELVDSVISARWMVPVAPDASEVLEHASVALRDGRIVAVENTEEVKRRFHAEQWLDYPQHIVLPGLINAHTHSSMTLMRGKGDDEPLFKWLHQTIWPIELALVGEEFCHDGTTLASVEMLKSGTTTFSDMYWYPGACAAAAKEVGIRAVIGMIMVGFPSKYATSQEEYIARGNEARGKFARVPTVHFSYAPHAPYTVGDETLEHLGQLCEKEDVPLHIHLHETADECSSSEALDRSPMCHRSEFASRPVANFERMGILNERLVAAHCVHLNDEEIALLAERKVNVVHCPVSNLKLASGFCPVSKLLQAGVNVCIGTDGSASNNSLDMIAEMKQAAILAKAVSQDATSVPAATALKMATLNGAKALGLEDRIGSLEVGKQADMIAVELGSRSATTPVFEPLSTLVYSAHGADVTDAWVNGEHVMEDRKVQRVDESAVLSKAHEWVDRINALPLKCHE